MKVNLLVSIAMLLMLQVDGPSASAGALADRVTGNASGFALIPVVVEVTSKENGRRIGGASLLMQTKESYLRLFAPDVKKLLLRKLKTSQLGGGLVYIPMRFSSNEYGDFYFAEASIQIDAPGFVKKTVPLSLRGKTRLEFSYIPVQLARAVVVPGVDDGGEPNKKKETPEDLLVDPTPLGHDTSRVPSE